MSKLLIAFNVSVVGKSGLKDCITTREEIGELPVSKPFLLRCSRKVREEMEKTYAEQEPILGKVDIFVSAISATEIIEFDEG